MHLLDRRSPTLSPGGVGITRGLFILLCVAFCSSCQTTVPYQESVSDYYWDIQKLRQLAQDDAHAVEAWREIGVIYTRTGEFTLAERALSRALLQERGDSRLWFYAGVVQELQGNNRVALERYREVPVLSDNSIYNQAIRGRIALLEKGELQRLLVEEGASEIMGDKQDYAVLSMACEGMPAQYEKLGKVISEVLSRNLDQIRDVNVLDQQKVRMVEQLITGKDGSGQAAPASSSDVEEVLTQMFGVQKFFRGTCRLADNNLLEIQLQYEDRESGQTLAFEAADRLQNMPEIESELMNSIVDGLEIWIPSRERRLPLTRANLETLSAYCSGTELEEEGRLNASLGFYAEAYNLDPGFALAEAKIEFIQNQILVGGEGPAELMGLLQRVESEEAGARLMDVRTNQAIQAINAGITPGQDTRKLPGANIGELPTPPVPTGN